MIFHPFFYHLNLHPILVYVFLLHIWNFYHLQFQIYLFSNHNNSYFHLVSFMNYRIINLHLRSFYFLYLIISSFIIHYCSAKYPYFNHHFCIIRIYLFTLFVLSKTFYTFFCKFSQIWFSGINLSSNYF